MEFYYEDMTEEHSVSDILDNIGLITEDMKNGLKAIADMCLDRDTMCIDPMALNGLMRLLSSSAHVIKAKVLYALELEAKERKEARS